MHRAGIARDPWRAVFPLCGQHVLGGAGARGHQVCYPSRLCSAMAIKGAEVWRGVQGFTGASPRQVRNHAGKHGPAVCGFSCKCIDWADCHGWGGRASSSASCGGRACEIRVSWQAYGSRCHHREDQLRDCWCGTDQDCFQKDFPTCRQTESSSTTLCHRWLRNWKATSQHLINRGYFWTVEFNTKQRTRCLWLSCRYVPQADEAPGLEFGWPLQDKTMVQVDHSSVTPESTHTEVMTLYKFLCHLERVKRITEYKISYSNCSRMAPGSAGSGDGFNISLKEPHKYKCTNASERTSAKTFFGPSMTEVEQSTVIGKVFRFRFERVSSCIKVQKPYCILLKGVSLKANQPTQVAWLLFEVLRQTQQLEKKPCHVPICSNLFFSKAHPVSNGQALSLQIRWAVGVDDRSFSWSQSYSSFWQELSRCEFSFSIQVQIKK